jgi:hypothetical protein
MSNRASEWPDDYDARLIAAAPEMLEMAGNQGDNV